MDEVMGDRVNDCYYLVYIGTKPSARGRGYASKLMRDMIAKVLPTFTFRHHHT
jgi:ribosomal protein S18 acetylase RimI-like enzyme